MGRALSGLGKLIAPDVLCFDNLFKRDIENMSYRDSWYETLLHGDFNFNLHKFQYE